VVVRQHTRPLQGFFGPDSQVPLFGHLLAAACVPPADAHIPVSFEIVAHDESHIFLEDHVGQGFLVLPFRFALVVQEQRNLVLVQREMEFPGVELSE